MFDDLDVVCVYVLMMFVVCVVDINLFYCGGVEGFVFV